MNKRQRDFYTGHVTTGHEWDGITELNTRVPRLLLWALALTFLFSVVYWILLPAWPSMKDHTRGWLSRDQKQDVALAIRARRAEQNWLQRGTALSIDAMAIAPEWRTRAITAGNALFGDNCQGCHGVAGKRANGGIGFPRLNDSATLWGNQPKEILHTLRKGINSEHPDTRRGLMPAFGADRSLTPQQVSDVARYVRSLSMPALGDGSRLQETLSVSRGKADFARHCVACHGQLATGNPLLGAPALDDDFWIYGGSQSDVVKSIASGRAGIMPAWEQRLSKIELKLLALYVAQLPELENATDQQSVAGEPL